MTKQEVMKKVVVGDLTGSDASAILGISERHVRRLKRKVEQSGLESLVDGRGRQPRRKRISNETISELLRLRRELYRAFSIRHFYEFATEKHGLKLSYTKAKEILQEHHLAPRAPGRGKHRRKRERRSMLGMMMHLDASTHGWIEGLPNHDLIVMLDDATGRIMYARFFAQEGVLSTLAAVKHVLERYGRFCELYTDRGSHFCNTRIADHGPSQIQQGTVPVALKALAIRQIWAFSPQARGRGERAFGTIQGRLPQELALQGIDNYDDANAYLSDHFVEDFNRRFSVAPAQQESAFTPIAGTDLELLLSVSHSRIVRNDNTVSFNTVPLQIPASSMRLHYARCTVLVHEFPEGDLGVSYQGQLLARFHPDGTYVEQEKHGRKRKVLQGVASPVWNSPGHY